MSDKELKEILKMVEDGKITAEEASDLLTALEEENVYAESEADMGQASHTYTREADPNLDAIVDKVRGYWRIPLAVGVVVTVLGSLWMLGAMQSAGFGFWFYCAWIPFILGILVTTLAVGSKRSHWLFVKIKQAPGETPQNITFGFPLPLRFSAWILRNFGHHIQGLENVVGVEEILETLADTPIGDSALIVDVHDDNGEEVQVFIG